MLSKKFTSNGKKVWYQVRGKKRKSEAVAKDYLRLISKNNNGITKLGQLLLQESCQAYVYCVLGAQAKTRWKIIGDYANSFQTQHVFSELLSEVTKQNNTSILINSMRTAIDATKVRLDFCISPGLELLPSDMVFIKDTPGYNNILLVSTRSQKFGVNNVNTTLKHVGSDTQNTPISSLQRSLQQNLQGTYNDTYKDTYNDASSKNLGETSQKTNKFEHADNTPSSGLQGYFKHYSHQPDRSTINTPYNKLLGDTFQTNSVSANANANAGALVIAAIVAVPVVYLLK